MTEHRCYTAVELRLLLKLSRSSFYELKRAGHLTMLEELKPRIGGRARYRADLVDRWLAGQWTGPRAFTSHRKVVA